MKVKDLIAKLQTFDPELPVCLADWNEQYQQPNEEAAETVSLAPQSHYRPTVLPEGNWSGVVRGDYVCIGA